MPTLKQLTCSIELGSTSHALKEYGTEYYDGLVETFIAVPTEDVNFSIHLTSERYVAPGIAMFVYIDGQYQCNRNRRGLVIPDKDTPANYYQVDLRVRQKESKQPDGSFIGRSWTFHELNIVTADQSPKINADFLQNIGNIEVVVLRCKEAPAVDPIVSNGQASPVVTVPREKPKKQKAPSSSSSSKRSAPPPGKKSATQSASSKGGGMFGLFDGPADDFDFSFDNQPKMPNPHGFDYSFNNPKETAPDAFNTRFKPTPFTTNPAETTYSARHPYGPVPQVATVLDDEPDYAGRTHGRSNAFPYHNTRPADPRVRSYDRVPLGDRYAAYADFRQSGGVGQYYDTYGFMPPTAEGYGQGQRYAEFDVPPPMQYPKETQGFPTSTKHRQYSPKFGVPPIWDPNETQGFPASARYQYNTTTFADNPAQPTQPYGDYEPTRPQWDSRRVPVQEYPRPPFMTQDKSPTRLFKNLYEDWQDFEKDPDMAFFNSRPLRADTPEVEVSFESSPRRDTSDPEPGKHWTGDGGYLARKANGFVPYEESPQVSDQRVREDNRSQRSWSRCGTGSNRQGKMPQRDFTDSPSRGAANPRDAPQRVPGSWSNEEPIPAANEDADWVNENQERSTRGWENTSSKAHSVSWSQQERQSVARRSNKSGQATPTQQRRDRSCSDKIPGGWPSVEASGHQEKRDETNAWETRSRNDNWEAEARPTEAWRDDPTPVEDNGNDDHNTQAWDQTADNDAPATAWDEPARDNASVAQQQDNAWGDTATEKAASIAAEQVETRWSDDNQHVNATGGNDWSNNDQQNTEHTGGNWDSDKPHPTSKDAHSVKWGERSQQSNKHADNTRRTSPPKPSSVQRSEPKPKPTPAQRSEPKSKTKSPITKDVQPKLQHTHRRHRSGSDGPGSPPRPKAYWNDWNKKPESLISGTSEEKKAKLHDPYIGPAEPLPPIPESDAARQGVEHQVQIGKAAPYVHLCSKPEYLDTMDHPYAVLRFKYRSKKVVERMFNVTIKEEGESTKARLEEMTRSQLMEEVLKLKLNQKSSSSARSMTTAEKISAWKATPSEHRQSVHSAAKASQHSSKSKPKSDAAGSRVKSTAAPAAPSARHSSTSSSKTKVVGASQKQSQAGGGEWDRASAAGGGGGGWDAAPDTGAAAPAAW